VRGKVTESVTGNITESGGESGGGKVTERGRENVTGNVTEKTERRRRNSQSYVAELHGRCADHSAGGDFCTRNTPK